MEFMIVRLEGYDNTAGIHVLVNSEKNGYVNDTIMLSRGTVYISADMPKAETRKIYLSDTTETKPMEVILHVLP